MLKKAFKRYSQYSRKKRASILFEMMPVDPSWRVLDLGGGAGDHIHQILPDHRNVVIADLLPEELAAARARYGYDTVQIDGSDRLPFADKQFDLVFCSSVIEHVTGPKEQMVALQSGETFRQIASRHQTGFAKEIRRIARRYYVQTPHKYFIVESHSWLPGVVVALPRPTQVRVLDAVGRSGLWPKQTSPDWNLLVPNDMQAMFPDAEIVVERSLGLPKSIMAIKADASLH